MMDIEQIKADMAAGTPGPWRRTLSGKSKVPSEFGVENVKRRGVCSTGGYEDGRDGTYEENKANARRIARVPDLEARIIADSAVRAAADALAEAVRKVIEEGVQDRVTPWRKDGVISKMDKCGHGMTISEGCEACSDEYLDAALSVYRAATEAET